MEKDDKRKVRYMTDESDLYVSTEDLVRLLSEMGESMDEIDKMAKFLKLLFEDGKRRLESHEEKGHGLVVEFDFPPVDDGDGKAKG